LLERGAGVAGRRLGRREVDDGVATRDVGLVAQLDAAHLVPGRLQLPHDRSAGFPLRTEERDLHAAACSTSVELARPTAERNRASSGPTPAAASRSGGSSPAASSASSSGSTASISAITRPGGRTSGSGPRR